MRLKGGTHSRSPDKRAFAMMEARRPKRCPLASISTCCGRKQSGKHHLHKTPASTPHTESVRRSLVSSSFQRTFSNPIMFLLQPYTCTRAYCACAAPRAINKMSASAVRKVIIKGETKTNASQDHKGRLEMNLDATKMHKVTNISLMQPELLNHQHLQETLKLYRIPLKGSETRGELLKLFEDHVRPKPQRLSSNPHKTNTSKCAQKEEKAASLNTLSALPLPAKRTTASKVETLDVPTSKKPALPDRPSVPRLHAVPDLPEGAQQSGCSGVDVRVGGNSGGTNLPQKRNATVRVSVCVHLMVHCTLHYILYCTYCTLHYILYCTECTLHVILYILYIECVYMFTDKTLKAIG